MSFREQAKEPLTCKVPVALATVVRERAGRERRSLSEVVTEALCETHGIDPATFGIKHSEPATA